MNRFFGQTRVLLTHSNHVFYDKKQQQKMEPYPPLQTLLAAAVLRRAGFEVEVCDVSLKAPEECLQDALDRMAPCLLVVCEDGFNFLSKMCLSRNRELSFWIAGLGRQYGCTTAIHGADSTDRTEDYLRAGFDCVLIGEVEQTLLEMARNRHWDQVAGLALRDEATGRIRRTAPRPLQTDLDRLPSPAWDLIDVEVYRKAWLQKHGYFSLNVVSSRGCPYRCNWCAKPTYGNAYHCRSPRAVASEMRMLKSIYAPDHIWFADDIFALSARWTREFADAVDDLDAAIPFKMQSRCDLMTRESVADLKRAGCSSVWMGAESGSQRILDAMDKGTQVPQILQATENLRAFGISVGLFLQFGYPGEGWEDVEKTINMVRTVKPDDIGVSVSYPLPGTKFFQTVSAQIGAQTNWKESGDLAMMFRGTYSTSLYRALARALHLEVRSPNDPDAINAAWASVGAEKSRCTSPATSCFREMSA
jgi:anaerobic magnesium-protoporphyrin IX monomethyl ester cyclase